MKLDPRIEKESLIYTPFSKAEINLHEKGYFTNDITAFDNLKNCAYGELDDRDIDLTYPYWCKPDDGSLMDSYLFYIPESSLKPAEKDYRPFTLSEFTEKFPVGQPIKFRSKGDVVRELYLILLGYRLALSKDQTVPYISIGHFTYLLDELFNNYEWQDPATGDWVPFGVVKE